MRKSGVVEGACRLVVACAVLGPASICGAAESLPAPRLTIGHVTEYTSNARLAESGAQDDVLLRPRLDLDWQLDRRRLDASARYGVQHRAFANGTLDADSILTGTGRVAFEAVPARLTVSAHHSRTESLRDVRQQANLDNRQVVQNATVDVQSRLGTNRDALRLGLTAGQTSVDLLGATARGTLPESARMRASVDYQRRLSARLGAGLSASREDVEYDDDRLRDFVRETLAMTGDWQFRGGLLTLRLGANRIDREGEDARIGEFVDLRLDWSPGAAHGLELTLSRSVNDQDFGTTQQQRFVTQRPDELVNAGSLYELSRLRVRHVWDIGRWQITSIFNTQLEDLDVPRDEFHLSLATSVRRRVTRDLSAFLRVRGGRVEFLDENREDTDLSAALGFERTLGRRTHWGASVAWQERDSSTSGNSFEEFTFALTLERDLR